jgi:hypothetical protein
VRSGKLKAFGVSLEKGTGVDTRESRRWRRIIQKGNIKLD